MIFNKKLFLLLIVLTFQSNCYANNESSTISIGNRVTLDSKILNEQQTLFIYTPDNYDPQEKYHVLYLLDGEPHFHSATGIIKYLVANNFISEAIVVGVKTNVRVRDFIPAVAGKPKSERQQFISRKFPESGGADKFLNYFEQELIPYIDQHYSTLPHRTLIGHSNGGVFALHTLLTKPNLFSNYLIMSPMAWWSEQEIDQGFSQLFKAKNEIKANLFLTVANEGKQILSNGLRIAANLELHAPKSFNWRFTHMEEETHMSIIHPGINLGMKQFYKELKISDLDAIAQYSTFDAVKKFYRALSDKYGYPMDVPPEVIEELAYLQVKYGKYHEAIAAFKQNTKDYPEAASVFKSLGDGYMASGEYSLAKNSYQQAVDLAKKHHSRHVDFYRDMLKSAETKL